MAGSKKTLRLYTLDLDHSRVNVKPKLRGKKTKAPSWMGSRDGRLDRMYCVWFFGGLAYLDFFLVAGGCGRK